MSRFWYFCRSDIIRNLIKWLTSFFVVGCLGIVISWLTDGSIYQEVLKISNRNITDAATVRSHETLSPQFDVVLPDSGPDLNQYLQMRALGHILGSLPKADISFEGPKLMKLDDKRQVNIRVGFNVPKERFDAALKAGNQQVNGRANVSSEMIATLTGPGFQIEAITPEQQTIAEGFLSVWSWNVEAKETGDQELEATLYALVQNGQTKIRQRVNSYTQTIIVSVREKTWDEWLQSLSHEVDTVKATALTLGGIATAILGWFGVTSALQKKKKAAELFSSGKADNP